MARAAEERLAAALEAVFGEVASDVIGSIALRVAENAAADSAAERAARRRAAKERAARARTEDAATAERDTAAMEEVNALTCGALRVSGGPCDPPYPALSLALVLCPVP